MMCYLRNVRLSSLDFHVTHSGAHRSRVIVSVKAELKPRAAAEPDNTGASQRWTDWKRFDQLDDEIEHGVVPVVIPTTSRVHYTR